MSRKTRRDREFIVRQLLDLQDQLTEASKEISSRCIWLRFGQAVCLLQLRGYSEEIAYKAAHGARRAAERAIANGVASAIEDREKWFLARAFRHAYHRSCSERYGELQLDEPESVQATFENPSQEAMCAAIEEALDKLEPVEAAAIIFFRRRLSFQEIGKRLDVAAATAHKLVHCAIRHLRALILPKWEPGFLG